MKKIFSFIIIASILAFCTPGIVMTGSWKNPKLPAKNYNSFFVAALTGNAVVRSTVESNIAASLKNANVQAAKSIDEFPPKLGKDSIDRQLIMSKVKNKNADAILVCLIRKKTESYYVPASYDGFWGYYTYWYPYIYSPGYYTEDEVYFFDASLYDSKTEELLWSAQSRSYNSTGLNSFSKQFGDLMVKRLKSDGILN